MVELVFIINKSGGLIYKVTRARYSLDPFETDNKQIMMGSLFHAIHTFAQRIAPTPHSGGLETLEVGDLRLRCFQSLTGIKFVAVSLVNEGDQLPAVLQRVYNLYTDYVLKNPFYTRLDNPIRCKLFDQHMRETVMEAAMIR